MRRVRGPGIVQDDDLVAAAGERGEAADEVEERAADAWIGVGVIAAVETDAHTTSEKRAQAPRSRRTGLHRRAGSPLWTALPNPPTDAAL